MKTLKTNDKVEINTCIDLYKLPINVLKSTKIYNFKGKYFDKIYEEALRIEKNNAQKIKYDGNHNGLKFDTIEFEIFYLTEFGQRLKLLGSIDELGNWDAKTIKGLDLLWNAGNVWKGQIPFREKFEFKFVFLQSETVFKWESGENRSFDFKNITENLIPEKLDKDGKIIINKSPNLYVYDKNTGTVKIKCIWKN